MIDNQTLALTLNIQASWCNQWPNLEVICNNVSYWSGQIEDKKRIAIAIDLLDVNELKIKHFEKRFGEGRVWGTRSQDGTITQDRAFRIDSLIFDEVDIARHIMRFPFVRDNGQEIRTDYFGFNGELVINFRSPVYQWIIEDLVRVSTKPSSAPDLIIETSHSDLFDYDQDLIEIKKIHQLLRDHAHLFS